MKLYHGTNIEFTEIELDKCSPRRDFGRGFYLTNIYKHAKERAQDRVDDGGGIKTVMEFDFDFDEIIAVEPSLCIKRFPEVNEEWANFVMHNRMCTGTEPTHEYDIVEGPIADDKMYLQFRRYSRNKMKLHQFIQSLKYPKEATHQIAFCTEKAINMLLQCSSDIYTKIENRVSELSVALMQDRNINNIEAMKLVYHAAVFAQFSDENAKLYQKPWQEIYELLKTELNNPV